MLILKDWASGLTFVQEELDKEQEKYRRNPNRGARRNTKYHRLCVAIETLNSFYPSNSKY